MANGGLNANCGPNTRPGARWLATPGPDRQRTVLPAVDAQQAEAGAPGLAAVSTWCALTDRPMVPPAARKERPATAALEAAAGSSSRQRSSCRHSCRRCRGTCCVAFYQLLQILQLLQRSCTFVHIRLPRRCQRLAAVRAQLTLGRHQSLHGS